MKVVVSAIAAALSFAGMAFAQAPVSNPTALADFKIPNLQALTSEMGWQSNVVTEGGQQVLIVSINSRQVALWPVACNPQTGACAGLYCFALIPDRTSAAVANDFNVAFNPARATIRDGQVVLDRYIIGDYGVARGSLVIDLAVQADLINQWWNFKQSQSVSAQVAFAPILEAPKDVHKAAAGTTHLDRLAPSDTLLDQISAGNGAIIN